MSNVVTSEAESRDTMINFGIGQPSADCLPLGLMQQATDEFYRVAQPLDLNYGDHCGDQRYCESLAGFLSENYGQPCEPDKFFLTAGNSQALDFICSHFSSPGDTIIVEEPSYFLAFQIFIDHGLNIVSVPVDEEGMDIDALESVLHKTKPRLLYTIPSYQNPTGRTMSGERRRRLIELSTQHGFLILADEVYQLLSYYDAPPEAMGTMCDSGSVISLGSFSKILAPGLRLGWIQSSKDIIQRLNHVGAVKSGGCLNHFTSHVVRHAMDMGLLRQHLMVLRQVYRERLETMNAGLKEHLAEHAVWVKPTGGYFIWLRLDSEISSRNLQLRARQLNVGFHPGELFSSCGGLDSYFRLSFAFYSKKDIRKGIARLGSVVNT